MTEEGNKSDPKLVEEYISTLKEYVKKLEEQEQDNAALIKGQKDLIQMQREQIHSHRQWSAHERSLMKSSRAGASEQRAILVYVLERSEKSKHWLRLWETLPKEQKDVYRAEAEDWLEKNPIPCPDDGREVLLPAPQKGLCEQTHLDDPRQERWVFCPRCGAYLGFRDLKNGQLILGDKDVKVVPGAPNC